MDDETANLRATTIAAGARLGSVRSLSPALAQQCAVLNRLRTAFSIGLGQLS
jgi:hypothetical protein